MEKEKRDDNMGIWWPRILLFWLVGSSCAAKETAWWTTNQDHKIVYVPENRVFHLKGINWFGYETQCTILGGLEYHELDYYLDMLQRLKYNALRVPFGYETILNWEQAPVGACLSDSNQWLAGMSVRSTMHVLFQKAMERHMVILLDFHTIAYEVTQYPWSDQITTDIVLNTWKEVVWEFARYVNLLGIDIKNEPHGSINWPVWAAFVTQFIAFVKAECPPFKGLFFVGGIQESSSVWGGGFTSMDHSFETLLPDSQVVFSPHVYGYSIRGDVALQDTYQTLDTWFGFLLQRYPNPVVLGEIGGWAIDEDRVWHHLLESYLIHHDIRDFFYWCLNTDSRDTGGLVGRDWTTLDVFKVDFHSRIQPNPTTDIDFVKHK